MSKLYVDLSDEMHVMDWLTFIAGGIVIALWCVALFFAGRALYHLFHWLAGISL